MKTKLPLPKTKKFVSNEVIDKLDWPFYKAGLYDVCFTQSDIDYINETIITHKLYRLIRQKSENNSASYNRLRRYAKYINFFNVFINDPNCPKNVKVFLNAFIDWIKYPLENKGTKDLIQTQMIMELWMEKCR